MQNKSRRSLALKNSRSNLGDNSAALSQRRLSLEKAQSKKALGSQKALDSKQTLENNGIADGHTKPPGTAVNPVADVETGQMHQGLNGERQVSNAGTLQAESVLQSLLRLVGMSCGKGLCMPQADDVVNGLHAQILVAAIFSNYTADVIANGLFCICRQTEGQHLKANWRQQLQGEQCGQGHGAAVHTPHHDLPRRPLLCRLPSCKSTLLLFLCTCHVSS